MLASSSSGYKEPLRSPPAGPRNWELIAKAHSGSGEGVSLSGRKRLIIFCDGTSNDGVNTVEPITNAVASRTPT